MPHALREKRLQGVDSLRRERRIDVSLRNEGRRIVSATQTWMRNLFREEVVPLQLEHQAGTRNQLLNGASVLHEDMHCCLPRDLVLSPLAWSSQGFEFTGIILRKMGVIGENLRGAVSGWQTAPGSPSGCVQSVIICSFLERPVAILQLTSRDL